MASLLLTFCLIFFSYQLIQHVGMEYPNWQGESKDQDWKAVFTKNEDAPNEYSGNLYWIGDTDKADNTYVESLIVKKDDEILLSSDTEIPIRDYSGGTSLDGSAKEESISFLERLDEHELEGHDITIEVKWKQGDHYSASQLTLNEKTLFD
ncbi:YdhH/YoaO family protein [Bacillus spizizenii]|nr:YdhH/YoaO family protein [Bacillus spizizenii]MCY8648449.1 YdhH/YoaO family protein [Bacillus spizizenii]